MDPLLALTCAALSGLASKQNGGHGVPVRPVEDIGREAVEMARAALAELERSEKPKGKR